jgi:alpha,alpha-trehalase
VAILSGRALLDVKNKVGLDTIAYAGSHGFNIEGPGESFHDERGQKFLPFLDKAELDLITAVRDIRGIRVERKPYALAVHYRLADDRVVPEL